MQTMRLHVLATTLALGIATVTTAAEYRSTTDATVLYDGPTPRAAKRFIAPKGMPLEIVVNDPGGAWVKVRERGGEMVWVEKKALAEKRMLAVMVPLAQARATADDAAAVVFQAEQDVSLEAMEVPSAAKGWVRVKHRDGLVGFVKLAQVWGWQ